MRSRDGRCDIPIFEFICSRGHVNEHIRPVTVQVEVCAVCGNPAPRRPAHRIAITRPEVDTRGMFRRYQTATQEMDYAATQIEANTGQPVETPSIWQAAKATAAAMNAAGENPFTKP